MEQAALRIGPARSDADIAVVTEPAWEFVGLLRARYPERAAGLRRSLTEQRFAPMLANFRDHFGSPVHGAGDPGAIDLRLALGPAPERRCRHRGNRGRSV